MPMRHAATKVRARHIQKIGHVTKCVEMDDVQSGAVVRVCTDEGLTQRGATKGVVTSQPDRKSAKHLVNVLVLHTFIILSYLVCSCLNNSTFRVQMLGDEKNV
jgi:hypothetical protein